MPIIWGLDAGGPCELPHAAPVARPVQSVQHAIVSSDRDQLLQARILWHGVDDASAPAGKSSSAHGESPANRGRQ